MREEGENKFCKMDERFAALEARLEDPSSKTNAMNMTVDIFHSAKRTE